jgi:hypothetical protein
MKSVGYYPAMSLIRGLFWLILFLAFTFCFLVVFEYGIHDFSNGCQKEFKRIKTYVMHEKAKLTDKAKK